MAKVTLLPILLIFHVHVYNQLVDLQVLQGEKYLGVECCVILVSLHEQHLPHICQTQFIYFFFFFCYFISAMHTL